MWRPPNVFTLLLALTTYSALASEPTQTIDLSRKAGLLRADFVTAHAAHPDQLTLSITLEDGGSVEATLRAYEPFRTPRVVLLDGQRLDSEAVGGRKRYYRGYQKNQPDTFAFLILSATGEATLSLETNSGKFRGELQSTGFRLMPIDESDAALPQGTDPDFIIPPELIPESIFDLNNFRSKS